MIQTEAAYEECKCYVALGAPVTLKLKRIEGLVGDIVTRYYGRISAVEMTGSQVYVVYTDDTGWATFSNFVTDVRDLEIERNGCFYHLDIQMRKTYILDTLVKANGVTATYVLDNTRVLRGTVVYEQKHYFFAPSPHSFGQRMYLVSESVFGGAYIRINGAMYWIRPEEKEEL